MFSLAGVAMVVSGKVTFSSLEPVDAGDSGAKRYYKRKFARFQTSSLLIHLIQFVKSRWIFSGDKFL